METYGDLKKAIKSIQLKKKGEKVGKATLDAVLGSIPGLGVAKSTFDVVSAAFRKPDTKKSNSWLDKLDIDDEMEAIVDDTVENGFLKMQAKVFDSESDDKPLEQDFNMNAKMVDYLKKNYKQRTVTGISEQKSVFDKFFTKFAYKFDKGYPDMNNDQDVLLLESLISEVIGEKFSLQEKALNFNDIAGESRKLIRMTIIADKIREKTPFTLQDGEKEVVLSFNDPSYEDLFTNQKVDTLRDVGGRSINNFKFFVDSEGNEYSLKQIKKTKELGGTGGSKAQTSERQERGLIDAINSVEGVKTLVGKNGFEIPNIIKAEKQPDPPRAEAYADLRLIRKGEDPYLLSAKGIVTPSIAGGGLTGITQINNDLANFVADFYQDAYEYYKEIFDANDEIDYNTNLYKTNYMRDVNRVVPSDLIDDMLRGNEAMGGPVDGYYIGPMEVEYEVKGDKIITNGDVIPLDTFADKYDKIFMHIKKRSGDYYFTDALQTVNGVTMPLIFTNKPGGKMAKSRLGTNPKSRGQIII